MKRESITKSDYQGGLDYVREEALEEGKKINAIQNAARLKAIGVPLSQIAEGTKLSIEQIQKL